MKNYQLTVMQSLSMLKLRHHSTILKDFYQCIFFLLPLFILSGCEKEDPFSHIFIDGTVLESGTVVPMPGLKVYLVGKRHSQEIKLDSIVTDANGRFSFSLKKPEDYTLSAKTQKENYFAGSTGDFTSFGKKKVTIYMYPKAWIKFHVKNVHPYDDNDRINCPTGTPESLWSFSSEAHTGQDVDFIRLIERTGNNELKFLWDVTKKGRWYLNEQTIYLPKHDTVEVEIFY